MRNIVLGGVALLLLAACSALTPAVMMQREYAKASRQVGITPVYPPREEFQVGDVYLVSVERDDPNASLSVWLDSSESLRREAEEFLKTRVVFADTGIANPSVVQGQKANSQVDLFSPQISTRAQERVLSLPVAAFPSVTTQAGFTASTGLTGAMAALGFGASEETTVTLDFNDVRTYWVPQVLARDYELEAVFIANEKAAYGAEEMRGKIATFEYNEGRKSRDRCLRIAMVTRVYLTREIDYTYRDRAILAAGLKIAAEEGTLATVAPAPTINVNINKSGAGSTDAEAIDAEFAETAKIAEEMRKAVATSTEGKTSEGGAFSFTSWSARGLTFKRTYQRPVAIGWEGFTFDLDPGTYAGQQSCLGAKPIHGGK